MIEEPLCDIHRDDSAFGAKVRSKQSSKQSRPRADVCHDIRWLQLDCVQNFLSLCKNLAAFNFETFRKGFRIRVAKRVVDARTDAFLLSHNQTNRACHKRRGNAKNRPVVCREFHVRIDL